MPMNPSSNPITAFDGIFDFALNNPMITIHNGKIAAMIAPSPAEMYLTPQVVSPLLKMKFNKLSTSTGPHSFPFGRARPFAKKKIT